MKENFSKYSFFLFLFFDLNNRFIYISNKILILDNNIKKYSIFD
jgi:hypothetical protein